MDENNPIRKQKANVPMRENGVLTLSLGFSTNMQDPRAVAAQAFQKEVEERTEGTIVVEIHSDAQLGSDAELISKVISGQVDFIVSSAGNFSGYVKNEGVSALPFLFEDFESAWEFMDGELIREIDKELLDYNVRVLSHFDNGFRCVTTRETPIDSPGDLAGMRIRVPDNAIIKETMSQLGARPISLDFAELKGALERGEFDGQENPIPVIYNSGLYELQHCLSITNHSYDAMPFVIADSSWQMMTRTEQEIVTEAARNAQTLNRELVSTQTVEYAKKLEERGMKITYPDLAAFKKKTESVAYFFKYDAALLKKIDEFIGRNEQ